MFATNNQPQYNNGFQPQYGGMQQAAPQRRMDAAQMLDQIDSQGAKSVKFDRPGETVTGTVEKISAAQVNVYDSVNQRPTNQPDYWQDGSPKLQVIVTIQTSLNDPSVEDDDGRRSIYIKGWGRPRKAWLEAIRKAGLRKASEIKPGDRFTARYVGFDPQSKNPNNPAKLYEYEIEHVSGVDMAMSQPQPAYQQPVQQQPQPQPMGQYQQVQPQTVQQAPAGPAYQQPQVGYSQPQQPQVAQQPIQQPAQQVQQPAQPQVQAVNPQQILQLKSLGKSPQEIAGLLNITPQQVFAVTDAASPSMHSGSEDQPEF